MGKMKIVYLLPLSLHSTRHVGDIIYLKKRVGSFGFCLLPQTFVKVGVECTMFFFIVKNSIPRNRDRQRSTKIAVEGTIFAFGFSKKYDLSLLLIEGRVLDRCRAFDRLVSVDAHLWGWDRRGDACARWLISGQLYGSGGTIHNIKKVKILMNA